MLTHFAAILAGALAHLTSSLSFDHVAPFLLFATAPVAVPAGGDGGADDDDIDDDDDEPGESIADAGRKLLEGLSAEEIKRQTSEELDDDDDLVDDVDGDIEGRADVEEVIEGADNKPVAGGKPKADAKKPGDAAAADDEPETAPAAKVVLPGIAARGEEDIEIEIDDKQVAERLRRLKNEVLRSRAADERRTDIDEREAKIEAYTEELEGDPVSFHLNRLSVDQQIDVARALILEHLEALQPEIDKLIEDPKARLDAQRALDKRMKESTAKFAQTREVRLHAKQCIRAAESLIPDGTDEATAAEFVADARSILGNAAKRGERITPQTVPTILARRVALYGFDKKPTKKAAEKPAAAAPARARPISDKAREIAARKSGTTDVQSQQARIRRTQAARAAGSKVAPAGAGAAPVQTSAVPAEAEQDIESMSKHLRGQKLPETWASIAKD